MSAPAAPDLRALRALRGLVATVCTTGAVDDLFAQCREDMRSRCDREGFHAIEWRTFPAVLVEAGRDAAVEHALANKYDWILQIDADATFPPTALETLLRDAYEVVPDADAVGAYCQLKGNYLPTIDTGTGTWEPHFPGEGILGVIRTGGHFLLAKTSAFRRFGPPWFRTRHAKRPIEAMAELDGFARQHLHNQNPFRALPEWEQLFKLAQQASGPASSVGEDSGFCDALTAHGGQIYVDTDLVTGHVAKQIINPRMFADLIEERARTLRLACGMTA